MIRLLCLLLLAAPPPDLPESGLWLTQDRSSVIAIAPCGSGLCGRIAGVSLDHPTDPPPRDLHGALQCGQTIIRMAPPGADPRWHGTILDPRSGHAWSAQIWLAPAASAAAPVLRLRGYLGIPLFGATQDWTRFAGPVTPDCHFTAGPRP